MKAKEVFTPANLTRAALVATIVAAGSPDVQAQSAFDPHTVGNILSVEGDVNNGFETPGTGIVDNQVNSVTFGVGAQLNGDYDENRYKALLYGNYSDEGKQGFGASIDADMPFIGSNGDDLKFKNSGINTGLHYFQSTGDSGHYKINELLGGGVGLNLGKFSFQGGRIFDISRDLPNGSPYYQNFARGDFRTGIQITEQGGMIWAKLGAVLASPNDGSISKAGLSLDVNSSSRNGITVGGKVNLNYAGSNIKNLNNTGFNGQVYARVNLINSTRR